MNMLTEKQIRDTCLTVGDDVVVAKYVVEFPDGDHVLFAPVPGEALGAHALEQLADAAAETIGRITMEYGNGESPEVTIAIVCIPISEITEVISVPPDKMQA